MSVLDLCLFWKSSVLRITTSTTKICELFLLAGIRISNHKNQMKKSNKEEDEKTEADPTKSARLRRTFDESAGSHTPHATPLLCNYELTLQPSLSRMHHALRRNTFATSFPITALR
ncbi:hypothetical protein RYX36_001292 [Vicia faba]